MYQDSPVASAMKLSESKGADTKAATNTVFVDHASDYIPKVLYTDKDKTQKITF